MSDGQFKTPPKNASHIQGVPVSEASPTADQVLKYNASTGQWTPGTDSTGGGGGSGYPPDYASLTGSTFTGVVAAGGGLSGSLQRTVAGLSYLVGAGSVTVTSQSNGQVVISGSGGSSPDLSGYAQLAGSTFTGPLTASLGIEARRPIILSGSNSTDGWLRFPHWAAPGDQSLFTVKTDDTTASYPVVSQNSTTLTFGNSSFNTNLNGYTHGYTAVAYCSWVAGGNYAFSTWGGGVQFFHVTPDFGDGVGVIGIKKATTNPTTNPTNGAILYVDSTTQALKWRSSGGVTNDLTQLPMSASSHGAGTLYVQHSGSTVETFDALARSHSLKNRWQTTGAGASTGLMFMSGANGRAYNVDALLLSKHDTTTESARWKLSAHMRMSGGSMVLVAADPPLSSSSTPALSGTLSLSGGNITLSVTAPSGTWNHFGRMDVTELG